MSLTNPSFETPGAQAWLADEWTATYVYSGWLIADFGVDSPRSLELFDVGWASDYVVSTGGINALFDLHWVPDYLEQASGIETFDHWRRFSVRFVLFDTTKASFNGLQVEGFIAGWNNDAWISAFDNTPADDDFSSWPPSPYLSELVGGIEAVFGTAEGPLLLEAFADLKPDIVFVVDPTTNIFSAPDHTLYDEQPVFVVSSGVHPGGLATGIQYYVIFDTADLFYLSKTPSGSVLDVLDPGTGTHAIRVEQTKFWTTTI